MTLPPNAEPVPTMSRAVPEKVFSVCGVAPSWVKRIRLSVPFTNPPAPMEIVLVVARVDKVKVV